LVATDRRSGTFGLQTKNILNRECIRFDGYLESKLHQLSSFYNEEPNKDSCPKLNKSYRQEE
jgi:hypothetical protein